MKEKEGVVNINFFKKIWYSVTKFEQYPTMATEGLSRALKYLIGLATIVSIVLVIGSISNLQKIVTGLAEYIDGNIPEFTVTDGKISMEIEKPIIIDEIKYDGIDRIVVSPLTETDEQKAEAEKENLIVGTTVFFFKDQIVLESKSENNETTRQPYTYSEFVASYTGENIETFNKSQLVEYLTSSGMMSFYARYALSIFIYILILNLMVVLLDTLEIAILGWITTRVARIKMKFVAIYNMAAYSLTLPIILNILYIIINYFTEFTISYFQVAYITIAYIYLAAAIFIIKDDFIKKMKEEVSKIKKEQEKVREEIEEQEKQEESEKKEKEDNKEDKKEDEQGEEPQGSQA